MKKTLLLLPLLALPAAAEDTRQLVELKPAAQEILRKEMLENLIALNSIVTLLATNQVKEAGEVAEKELGRSAMGKNAALPIEARPGSQMPREMHQLAIGGHLAASDFARAAATGDRDKALAALPNLLGSCVACHASYRIR
ncbi:MAG: cytochrome C [Rhodocyclaceae bacterium]